MAKAVLVGGKLCAGKSFYAKKLSCGGKAVILSCDELILSIFDGDLGASHDNIVLRTKKYLYNKSLEILSTGTDVILDWGFWTRNERISAIDFYRSRSFCCEFHYVYVSDEAWDANIRKRNNSVVSGDSQAYIVDKGLMNKFIKIFEEPDKSEVDVWFDNDEIE